MKKGKISKKEKRRSRKEMDRKDKRTSKYINFIGDPKDIRKENLNLLKRPKKMLRRKDNNIYVIKEKQKHPIDKYKDKPKIVPPTETDITKDSIDFVKKYHGTMKYNKSKGEWKQPLNDLEAMDLCVDLLNGNEVKWNSNQILLGTFRLDELPREKGKILKTKHGLLTGKYGMRRPAIIKASKSNNDIKLEKDVRKELYKDLPQTLNLQNLKKKAILQKITDSELDIMTKTELYCFHKYKNHKVTYLRAEAFIIKIIETEIIKEIEKEIKRLSAE